LTDTLKVVSLFEPEVKWYDETTKQTSCWWFICNTAL